MTETRVAVLTPPGAGAIATVEVSGARAWEFARKLFRPTGKPLSDSPELHRFWFGTLGGDEVILAVTAPDTVEVHCHGGRRVVRWVVEQFTKLACMEGNRSVEDSTPAALLQRAPTLRTASILLDQFHGAFERAVTHILALLDTNSDVARGALSELARYAPIGRHLVEPWKVVVAGAPNVGKSSLVNALAGFQRAVVSEVAGTTRDLVSVELAFDGWPVELTDTAGLREAEGLEAEGVERARRAVDNADLILWVLDVTDRDGSWPKPGECRIYESIFVTNKIDLPHTWDPTQWNGMIGGVSVSATTGAGIPDLVAAIVRRLVYIRLEPGAAVPFTPLLADLVRDANAALDGGNVADAIRWLRECLARSG